MDLPWDPATLTGPQPPNLDHPLLVPPETRIWTLRSLMHHVHHKILGQGRWVWTDEGGIHQDKPLRVGGGGLQGTGGGNRNAHEEEGASAPPPLAQFNVVTPDVKQGGDGHWRFICMCW